jgi:hypothetical protein
MNVVFVEPFLPANQRQFARALAEAGATVIGIGEYGLDALDDQLKGWLYHYERVPSVTDVPALTQAVRWVQDKLWVDRLEATIEAHTMAAAQVREACTIPGTSVRTAWLCRDKPSMKEVLRSAGVPTAASAAVATAAEAAVGTPAERSTSFIDGLSRHSQAVRTDVPGMVQASLTCAAARVCASIVASSRSTHSLSCTHRTARVIASTSVTERTCS